MSEQVNWDFKYDPPTTYEIEVQQIIGILRCDYCEEQATCKISIEHSWGWGLFNPVCDNHREKIERGEM
jgi:hypothetical protein